MSRSYSGIIEGYLIPLGELDEFVNGTALPGSDRAIAIGISDNKEMKFEDYNSPKDAYNNLLTVKKKISLGAETLQTSLADFVWIEYFSRVGCDLLVVSEGCTEYLGNLSGVPVEDGTTWWRKNPTSGIFFFDYPNRTHMGLGYEYKLSGAKASIMLNLQAAMMKNKYLALVQNAGLNIIVKDGISLPAYDTTKFVGTKTKSLRIVHNSAYVDLFSWDEIDSRELSIKTVENLTSDARNKPNLIEVDLTVVGSNADIYKIAELWSRGLFSEVNLKEETQDGTELNFYFKANTFSNSFDPFIGKDQRNGTFKLSGQISIKRMTINSSNNSITFE